MTDDQKWTNIIEPNRGWLEIDFKAIWQYRDLIVMMVQRDFVALYKQTILGPLWYLLGPLFSTIVFTIVFGRIAQLPTGGLPPILFYMSGLVVWNYFAGCLGRTSNTFVDNAGIYGKVYFPRLVIPISVVITNMLTFGIQILLFFVFLVFFIFQGLVAVPSLWALFTPLLLLQMACLGLGCGIIVSSLTTKYRDLTILVGFGVQLWFYASPVVYPLSLASGNMKWLLIFNPMSAIIEVFRFSFLGGEMIPLWQWGISGVMTLGLLVIGIVLFSKVEKNFMDTV